MYKACLPTFGKQCINSAVCYVENNGLCFNPKKTNCTIVGKNPFVDVPKWYIHKHELLTNDNTDYLGATIGNNCSSVHVNNRISSCRKAFFALQGAGLCREGLNTDTAIHVWSTTCKNILTYGCDGLYLYNKDKSSLDKIQSRLVKCIVCIGPNYRTTPLLKVI